MTEAPSSLKVRCCWLPAASSPPSTGKTAQTGVAAFCCDSGTLSCSVVFQRGHREEARDLQNRLSQRHQGPVQPNEAALLRRLWQQDQRKPAALFRRLCRTGLGMQVCFTARPFCCRTRTPTSRWESPTLACSRSTPEGSSSRRRPKLTNPRT